MAIGPGSGGIIVADDDAVVRGILRVSFAETGRPVHLAASGFEALRLASTNDADLVVLDLNMPIMNGLLTCERLRILPGYEATPVVILTTSDDQPSRAAAWRAGATAFLTKPFRPSEVLDVLAKYLAIDPARLDAIRRNAMRAGSIANLIPRSGTVGRTGSLRGTEAPRLIGPPVPDAGRR